MTIRSTLWHSAISLLSVVRVDSIFRHGNRNRLLIVGYHGVHDGERSGRSWLVLPQEEFAKQLDYLRQNYEILSVDEGLNRLRHGELSNPTACITFDDGYKNNFTHAFPLLRDNEIPATIYLSTGLIGTDRRLWTTRIALALEANAPTTLDLREFGLGAEVIHDRASAMRTAHALCIYLKRFSPKQREEYVSALLEPLALHPSDDGGVYSMMTWDDVRSMASHGISFGAHTVNHEIVSRLSGVELREEVSESVFRVRAELSQFPHAISNTFAYPNGSHEDFDERAVTLLRDAGCSGALSAMDGLNDAASDPFALRRVVVAGDMTLDDFRARTAGVAELASRFRIRSRV